MPETEKIPVKNYTMKMQIYPSAQQRERIDTFLHALHVAYNITFHEVFQKNPAVCTEPNDEGQVWPDFKKMSNKVWLDYLRECNPIVKEVPAAAISTNQGLFSLDAKRAWETGMKNRPVNSDLRRNFHFYNAEKPRRSFMVQLESTRIDPSPDNKKVAWITLPKIEGRIKARGFNRKIWFGEGGTLTYQEAMEEKALPNKFTVRVSKDTCGSYYVSVTISENKEAKVYLETPVRENPKPIGIDVGIKDIAITSEGEKIPNRHIKKEKDAALRRMNRQLSRRWGPSNMAFRDYNREIRKDNRKNPEQPLPLAEPSKRYNKTKQNKARLERKVARRRNTYYHQQTAKLIHESEMIAIETLQVKNMMRNHKLAYSLADAAMSDFLDKLKYKADRRSVNIVSIGMFEKSSQLCNVCGEENPSVKNLSVRRWKCPACGAEHDRDINAAKNILAIARKGEVIKEEELTQEAKPRPSPKPRRRKNPQMVTEENPDIVVIYSKEHTKFNDPRYIIVNRKTGQTIDDAQGAGYRSMANAKNCYKAKRKYSSAN